VQAVTRVNAEQASPVEDTFRTGLGRVDKSTGIVN
jgi:hypothetical protein